MEKYTSTDSPGDLLAEAQRQSSILSTDSDGSHYDDDEEDEEPMGQVPVHNDHSGQASNPEGAGMPNSSAHWSDTADRAHSALASGRRGSAFTTDSSQSSSNRDVYPEPTKSRAAKTSFSPLPIQHGSYDANEQSSSNPFTGPTADGVASQQRSGRSSRDQDHTERAFAVSSNPTSPTSSKRSTLIASSSSPSRPHKELQERDDSAHHIALENELTRAADTEDPHRPRTLKEARAIAKERARLRKEKEAASPSKVLATLPFDAEKTPVRSTLPLSPPTPTVSVQTTFAESETSREGLAGSTIIDPPPLFKSEETVQPLPAPAEAEISVQHANDTSSLPPHTSARLNLAEASGPADSPMDDLQRQIGAALEDVSFASAGTVKESSSSSRLSNASSYDKGNDNRVPASDLRESPGVATSTDVSQSPNATSRLATKPTPASGAGRLSPALSTHDSGSFVSADDSPDQHGVSVTSETPASTFKAPLLPASNSSEIRLGRRGSEMKQASTRPSGPLLVYGINVPYPRAFMSNSVADKDRRRLAPWERARAYAQLTNELSQTESRLQFWIETVRRPSSRAAKAMPVVDNSSFDDKLSRSAGHRREEPSYAASVRSAATFPMRGDGGRAKEIVHMPINPESPPDGTPSNIPYPSLLSSQAQQQSQHGRVHGSEDSRNSIPFGQSDEELTPSRRRMKSHESTSDLRSRTASNVTLDAITAAQSTFSRAASNVAGVVSTAASRSGTNSGQISPTVSRAGGGAFFSSLTRKGSKRVGPASLSPSVSTSPALSGTSGPRTPGSVRGTISGPLHSATTPSPMRRSFDLLNSESAVDDSESPLPLTPSSPPNATTDSLPSPTVSIPLPSPSLRPEAHIRQPTRSPLGPRPPVSSDRLAPLPLPTRRGSNSSSREPTSPATDYSSSSPREGNTPNSPHGSSFTRSSLSYGSVRERPPPIRGGVAVTPSKKALKDQGFEEALSKLSDVLPDADPAVLAEYLKRANGNDLAAIGDYFLDQSTGKLLVPKTKRSGSRSPGHKGR